MLRALAYISLILSASPAAGQDIDMEAPCPSPPAAGPTLGELLDDASAALGADVTRGLRVDRGRRVNAGRQEGDALVVRLARQVLALVLKRTGRRALVDQGRALETEPEAYEVMYALGNLDLSGEQNGLRSEECTQPGAETRRSCRRQIAAGHAVWALVRVPDRREMLRRFWIAIAEAELPRRTLRGRVRGIFAWLACPS